MQRLTFLILAVVGGLWACGHLLLAAVAIGDGYDRCTGYQCSDAWTSGGYFAASASIGLLLALMSVARFRSGGISAELKTDSPLPRERPQDIRDGLRARHGYGD